MSDITKIHLEYADALEKESKRFGLPKGWREVLEASILSIRTLADALDAQSATRVDEAMVTRACYVYGQSNKGWRENMRAALQAALTKD